MLSCKRPFRNQSGTAALLPPPSVRAPYFLQVPHTFSELVNLDMPNFCFHIRCLHFGHASHTFLTVFFYFAQFGHRPPICVLCTSHMTLSTFVLYNIFTDTHSGESCVVLHLHTPMLHFAACAMGLHTPTLTANVCTMVLHTP